MAELPPKVSTFNLFLSVSEYISLSAPPEAKGAGVGSSKNAQARGWGLATGGLGLRSPGVGCRWVTFGHRVPGAFYPFDQSAGLINLLQCDRCTQKGVKCAPTALGPCKLCKQQKVGCTLMPRHLETRKPNRGSLTAEDVYQYRLEQHRAKKGKKVARQISEPQASGSAGSPSAVLQPLLALTLDSVSSNAASAAPSPLSQLPSVDFAVEIPVKGPPRSLPPPVQPRPVQPVIGRITIPRERRQRSPTALSISSEEGRLIIARVAALDARLDQLERRMDNAGI